MLKSIALLTGILLIANVGCSGSSSEATKITEQARTSESSTGLTQCVTVLAWLTKEHTHGVTIRGRVALQGIFRELSIVPDQVMTGTGNPYSPKDMKLLTFYCSNYVDLQFLAELEAGEISLPPLPPIPTPTIRPLPDSTL